MSQVGSKAQKIGFVSLGCPKNLVDSEVMMGLVAREGFTLTSDAAEADIIVVNTCAFIDPAKEESVETILEMAELKKTGRCRRLIVAGCLVERYRDELRAEIPEIDAMLGTQEIERIARLCRDDDASVGEPLASPPYLYDHTRPRVLATPPYLAYVKIAEGCDHVCSFCVIPRLRGPFRSRRLDSLVSEAEELAARGVKEIVLVGQDTTHYGADLGMVDGLATLLRRLARIPDLRWIRFLYGYPHHVTDALIDAVAEEEKVCAYFDIPFQHVSASVLQRMRRGGSRASLERLVSKIRSRIPLAALRTTFIVGYPGETDADFAELLDFCRAMELDHVGVFVYSDEEGTAAFEEEGKVPVSVAHRRARQLLREQARISRRKNQRLVGRTVTVLLDGYSADTDVLLRGRMESQAPEIDGHVLLTDVPDGLSLQPGDFLRVQITRALDHDLIGRVVGVEERARSLSRGVRLPV